MCFGTNFPFFFRKQKFSNLSKMPQNWNETKFRLSNYKFKNFFVELHVICFFFMIQLINDLTLFFLQLKSIFEIKLWQILFFKIYLVPQFLTMIEQSPLSWANKVTSTGFIVDVIILSSLCFITWFEGFWVIMLRSINCSKAWNSEEEKKKEN